MFIRRLLCICVSVFFLSSNVHAQDINAQGAKKLQNIFTSFFDHTQHAQELTETFKLDYKGETTVTPAQGYYTVTTPAIRISNIPQEAIEQEAQGEQGYIDIGAINLRAVPNTQKNGWDTTITFPNKIVIGNNIAPSKTLEFKISAQQATGFLSDDLGYFSELMIDFSNIVGSFGEEDAGITMGNLVFEQKFTPENNATGAEKYNGFTNITFKDLVLDDKKDETEFRLGNLAFKYDVTDITLLPLAEYTALYKKHEATLKKMATAGVNNEQTISADEIWSMFMDLYFYDMGGFSAQYSLGDLYLNDPNNEATQGSAVMIKDVKFNFGMDGFKEETGSLTFTISGDQLHEIGAQFISEEDKKIFPDKMQLSLDLQNIPYQALSQIAKTTLPQVAQNPEQAQMVGLGLVMRIPGILAQAGSKLVIDGTEISNDHYKAAFSGETIADLTSLTGMSTKLKLAFSGLDTLITNLQAKSEADNEQTPNAANTDDALYAMKKLQEIGNKSGDTYNFNIISSDQGGLLINGKDIKVLSQPKSTSVGIAE